LYTRVGPEEAWKADLDVENLRRAVELAPGQTYIKDSLAEALMIDGHHQEGREIVAELLEMEIQWTAPA